MGDAKHDPQEDNPEIREIIEKARVEAIEKLKEIPELKKSIEVGLGVHAIWKEQKQILKEKYGIDWKTPAEMNPDTIFD